MIYDLESVKNWDAEGQNQQNDPVRPAKTQISLGIHPVWSESSLSAWRNIGPLTTYWAHSEDWSDWADHTSKRLMDNRLWLYYKLIKITIITLCTGTPSSRRSSLIRVYIVYYTFRIFLTHYCTSHIMRKPVFAICKQQRRRSACASMLGCTFVVSCLDSIIPLLATSEISRL